MYMTCTAEPYPTTTHYSNFLWPKEKFNQLNCQGSTVQMLSLTIHLGLREMCNYLIIHCTKKQCKTRGTARSHTLNCTKCVITSVSKPWFRPLSHLPTFPPPPPSPKKNILRTIFYLHVYILFFIILTGISEKQCPGYKKHMGRISWRKLRVGWGSSTREEKFIAAGRRLVRGNVMVVPFEKTEWSTTYDEEF